MAATSSQSELIPARIVHVSKETPKVATLRLQAPHDYLWAPGQHLALHASPPGTAPSYYSIASAPKVSEPGMLELAASVESLPGGVRLEPGVDVLISRASGKLTAPRLKDSGALVLIGMGTGIAPLRAIVQAQEGAFGVQRVTVIQGARYEEELLFRDEFMRYAAHGLGYRPVLSRPGDAWKARTGWVSHHLDGLDPGANFRLCGSRAMVTEVTSKLEERGVARAQIDGEGY
jgi:NAD(P)H-flavin reductase